MIKNKVAPKLGKISTKKVEAPVVEAPVVEAPVVEAPVVEAPVAIDPLVGKTIGAVVILSSSKIEIRGKEYFKLKLSDNTETILSDRDIKEQGVK